MPGWPTIDRAEDQRLAQALRAGEPTALAQVFDAYAPRLFDYCHVLLRDEKGAFLALHDSLITVQERIGSLPDPRLFRSWLYAVTRAECVRRRARGGDPAERQRAAELEAPDQIDEATRRLVHGALLVLDGPQREALDLALRHGLDPHELAEILAVAPQDASVRVEQARNDLDDAFAAIVVATTGRDDCPSVPALAGPVGQPLDAERCGKLARHIGNCPICKLRANGKVATARLLEVMPVAKVPPNLRERVLTTAYAPECAETRAAIAARSDPQPVPDPDPEPRGSAPLLIAAGSLACALLIFGVVFVLLPGSGGQQPTGDQAAAAQPSDSTSAEPSSSEPAETPSTSHSPTPTPTPTKHKKKKKSPKPTHTATPTATQQPNPPKPPPGPGTLAISGCGMGSGNSCSIKLTAQGGPVDWQVTGTSDGLSASGGDRSLAANASTSVRVQRSGFCLGSGGNGTVSFSPGGSAKVTWRCW